MRDAGRGGAERAASEGHPAAALGRDARALRDRLAFCHHTFGQPWPTADHETLIEQAWQWLGLEFAHARPPGDLAPYRLAPPVAGDGEVGPRSTGQ
ncbi:hypothetical protein ACNTMW_31645 [Planosporangium sp. 12N6]|uniref:hypothetical protein n=1 Tax=Planosporangium spinosum TaxID=3402278 RepID=UPI003CF1F7EC